MSKPERKPIPRAALVAAVSREGSLRAAASSLNMPESTLRSTLKREPEFTVAPILTSGLSIDELITRRCAEFKDRDTAERANRLVDVAVKIAGPFGIVHFGDPHLDDPGSDMPLLLEHVRIVNETPGLMGACVGDLTNNWVGRLERLYAKQPTTQADAVKLGQWFIKSVPWMYLVGGNHDVWSGSIDPMKMLAKMKGIAWKDHGLRLALNLPNGRQLRINARHTFNGHSMWNANHGGVKAARMGFRDHVYVSGHIHTFAYQKIPSTGCDMAHHLLQLGAYKRWDEYADQGGFADHNAAPAMVTVVDPDADEFKWVQVFDDVASAAEYLTWLRKKRGVA